MQSAIKCTKLFLFQYEEDMESGNTYSMLSGSENLEGESSQTASGDVGDMNRRSLWHHWTAQCTMSACSQLQSLGEVHWHRQLSHAPLHCTNGSGTQSGSRASE